MQNVLIANSDIKQNVELCNYLTNDKIKAVGSTEGTYILEKYYELRPDIFILNTNLNYIEIIDRLSFDKYEKRNCNTLLVSNSHNFPICITNVAKIYKIFNEPKLQEISDTVVEMCNHALEKDIDLLLLKTKIYKSNGSDYIKNALIKCYYSPELLKDLNTIFNLVAKDFHTNSEVVGSAFRTALIPVNAYKEHNPQFTIFRFFEKEEPISPKAFLKVATFYLKTMKK